MKHQPIFFVMLLISVFYLSVSNFDLLISNMGWLYFVRYLDDGQISNSSTREQYLLNNLDLAEHFFSKAYDLDVENGSAWNGLCRLAVAKEDHNRALVCINNYLANNSNAASVMLNLGSLENEIGNSELAIELWRLARADTYFFHIAHAASVSGDLERALELNLLSTKINPKFGKAYLEAGKLYYDLDKLDLAKQAFKTSITISPDRQGFVWLGRANEAMGEMGAAIDAYKHAADLGELWDGYFAIGNIYLKIKEYDLAEEWYQRAHEAFPDVMATKLNLGRVALLRGDYELAGNYFLEMLSQTPEDPTVHYELAIVAYNQGNYAEALEWLDGALDRDIKSDYWFFKILGKVYHETGNCKLALQSYQSALKQNNVPETERTYIVELISKIQQDCR